MKIIEISEAEYNALGGYFANGVKFERDTDNIIAFKEYESANSAKGKYYKIVREKEKGKIKNDKTRTCEIA